MKIFRTIGRLFKPKIEISQWLDFKTIASTTDRIARPVKELFTVQAPAIPSEETFEEAIRRINLSEEQIQYRLKVLGRLVFFYLGISIALLIYVGYLIYQGSWHGALASFSLNLVSLAMAFRYHFWHFQLKQRKLGCSFREWLNSSFLGHRS